MSKTTLDTVLEAIRAELDLSRETEHELLEEIQGHLEDAVADAVMGGEDKEIALVRAAERFGVTEVGRALQEVHAPWESADAIMACLLPVFAALVLRWLAFAPNGTLIDWQVLLLRPAFWIVAIVALLVPLLHFRRWRYALIGWGFFWALTMIFIIRPTVQSW